MIIIVIIIIIIMMMIIIIKLVTYSSQQNRQGLTLESRDTAPLLNFQWKIFE